MIRNNHAREGGCDGDKEAKRGKTGRLVKSDRIYCLQQYNSLPTDFWPKITTEYEKTFLKMYCKSDG